MDDIKSILDGWDFMSNVMGNIQSTQIVSSDIDYIKKVSRCIDDLKNNINSLKSEQTDAVLGGFIAEEWSASTFNIDSAVKRSEHYAVRLRETGLASADIKIDGIIDYSLKFYNSAENSAKEQAAMIDGIAKYTGQKRLIPTDQIENAKRYLRRQELRNIDIRNDVSNVYRETNANIVDRLSTVDGVESKPLLKQESINIAKDVKSGEFDPGKYGYESAERTIENQFHNYFAKEAVKAGCSSAVITIALKIGPELFKIFDYLIKNGEIEEDVLIATGEKTISAGAEGFINGALTYAVVLMCSDGAFGKGIKSVAPGIIASIVTMIFETFKNSIKLTLGKINEKQMITSFVDGVVISSAYYVASIIGGEVAQAIGFEFPGVAFLIGSLIGTAFCAVYQIGKKTLVTLCMNSGITFFGFVEQSYSLSDEMMNNIGIALSNIQRTKVNKTNIRTINIGKKINKIEYSTFDIMVLKRGMIGFNKVGYELF